MTVMLSAACISLATVSRDNSVSARRRFPRLGRRGSRVRPPDVGDPRWTGAAPRAHPGDPGRSAAGSLGWAGAAPVPWGGRSGSAESESWYTSVERIRAAGKSLPQSVEFTENLIAPATNGEACAGDAGKPDLSPS